MARVYRFFIDGISNELGKDFVIVPGMCDDILSQMTKVLRINRGDRVVLLDGSNEFGENVNEFDYEVVSAHKKEVSLRFTEQRLCENESSRELELVLCLPNKPDKLSLILQKAVELGVSRVVLVSGDNSQMKHELKEERLARIMKEAAEQSERAFVPKLQIEGKLTEYMESYANRNEIFVAMERMEGREDSKDGLSGLMNGSSKCAIVIGPEGGFSPEEKEFVRAHGLKTFSLGKRILRMETAAIVALGLAALE